VTQTTVACIQVRADRRRDDIFATADVLISDAVAQGAQAVFLPERWNGTGDPQAMVAAAEPLDGPTARQMATWARHHAIWVHGGSIGEIVEPGVRAANTTLVFDPTGTCVARYRKIHMFDIAVVGATYRESATNLPGDDLVVCDLAGWRTGLTICFDLRFAEQYRALALAGAELFTVPSGFTLQTGRDHWEVLLRARAIENGAYVVAPNLSGLWGSIPTYARSMIVDPWGIVIANVGDGEGFCTATIDSARVTQMREQIPVLAARREGIYARPPGDGAPSPTSDA
jgi:predicted amidohydrolase